jgi:hypothetical protein
MVHIIKNLYNGFFFVEIGMLFLFLFRYRFWRQAVFSLPKAGCAWTQEFFQKPKPEIEGSKQEVEPKISAPSSSPIDADF